MGSFRSRRKRKRNEIVLHVAEWNGAVVKMYQDAGFTIREGGNNSRHFFAFSHRNDKYIWIIGHSSLVGKINDQ